jgi:hypothetical protein
VLRFRWLPSGGLLFLSENGWMLSEGGETGPIAGEPLEEALEDSARPWQHEKYKWRIGFRLEISEGDLKCDDVTGTLVGQLEVCLRKYKKRCNIYTFSREGDLPFPWDESMAPSGLEAFDLVAFPSKSRLLLGRGRILYLFTLAGMPEPIDEVLDKALSGDDPCEASFVHVDNFESVETVDDLYGYIDHLTATPYTIDGTGYLLPAQGGVWLGRFDALAEPVLVVPMDGGIARVAWSPDQSRIAILDSQGAMHVAEVEPPGLTTIQVDKSAIR